MRSPSMAGTSILKVSPWPAPIERLHSLFSCTSRSNFGSSAGGSSFLLLLLQPTAIKARASSAAFFQRITSRIPFCQIIELHLQTTDGGILRQSGLGLLVSGIGIVVTAELNQQIALEFFAAGGKCRLDLAIQ